MLSLTGYDLVRRAWRHAGGAEDLARFLPWLVYRAGLSVALVELGHTGYLLATNRNAIHDSIEQMPHWMLLVIGVASAFAGWGIRHAMKRHAPVGVAGRPGRLGALVFVVGVVVSSGSAVAGFNYWDNIQHRSRNAMRKAINEKDQVEFDRALSTITPSQLPEVFEALDEHTESADPDVRRLVASGFGKIGSLGMAQDNADHQYIARLASVSLWYLIRTDKDASVRRDAVVALASFGEARQLSNNIDLFQRQQNTEFRRQVLDHALKDNDEAVRQAAKEALAKSSNSR
jgi:hypothetical protein